MLTKGTILKNWVLGEKLGSGACSEVYIVTPVKGDGSESYAMKVSPLPPVNTGNKKRKKSHADRSADALYAEHLLYVNTLAGLDGIPALPPSGAYGEDKGYRFLVLQRLGRTLEDVRREYGALPERTVARVGLDILTMFRYLHSRKIIFVDVKPDNFMLERGQERKVYCVDFGIAERYMMVTGAHKPYKVGGVVGTPSFLSINCHNGSTPSRRDDIEALLYVCLYLIRGELPWQSAKSDTEGARLKSEIPLDSLCENLTGEWKDMLACVRGYSFDEEPDYTFFEDSLKRIAGSLSLSGLYEWNGEPKTKKAKTAKSVEVSKGALKANGKVVREKKASSPVIDVTNDEIEEKATARPNAKASSEIKGKVVAHSKSKAASDDETIPPAQTKTARVDEKKAPTNTGKANKENKIVNKTPSTRRVEAATRAVGAAAAANAAATIARRTRSATKALAD
ncbi:unnamed protein product [Aphanomyces euteiches]|uniref:Casein kinase I n=1 Tax=Aphanomyces euteiches TaxID=100861 RepID=A0A6G0X0L3_9STRA|nr:hypothetical protein Ae201684_009658 [Aphanomyces euteiches]KAH9085583.1 hypothetical protein Ae201684P_005289 [Aphanomyces euteiches]